LAQEVKANAILISFLLFVVWIYYRW